MTIKRVVFVRPGETEWNRIGRWQGQVAIPLNENGRMQAARLAQFMRPIGMTALYSSDLRRAADTAEIICEELHFRPVYEPRLRERHMGEWQGLTLEEIKAWYPGDYKRLLANVDSYQIPGGESRQQVSQRVHAAFEDIVGRGGDTVGIISHTTAIRALLSELVPDIDPYHLDFANMSVTTIHFDDERGSWRVAQCNDITHLDGMEALTASEVEKTS